MTDPPAGRRALSDELLIKPPCASPTEERMKNIGNESAPKLESALYSLIIACVYYFPVRYLVEFTLFPYLLEYREAASIYAALDFSNGINPYAVSLFPEHIYLYGPLYPLLLSLLIKAVQPSILLARIANLVFISLDCWILYRFFRLLKVSRLWAWTGILVVLNGFCLVLKINASRPDLLGEFFLLASLYVVVKYRASSLSLVLSILSATIGLYLKQYMLFPIGVIALYCFLAISKQKALVYGISSALLLCTSFAILSRVFPLLPEYFLVHHIHVASYSLDYMIIQTKFFVTYYWMFCGIFVVSLFHGSLRARANGERVHLNLRNPTKALLEGSCVDLITLYIIAAVFLLTFDLGGHIGNVYVYYLELLLPLLVLKAIQFSDATLTSGRFLRLGLLASVLLFSILLFRNTYATDFAAYRQTYAMLVQAIPRCRRVYATPLLAGVLLDSGRQSQVHDNGQIQYAGSAIIEDRDNPILRYFWSNQSPAQSLQLATWRQSISDQLNRQEFDCLFIMPALESVSTKGYRLVEEVPSVLGQWTVDVWIPEQRLQP